jgi:hypothetical protein
MFCLSISLISDCIIFGKVIKQIIIENIKNIVAIKIFKAIFEANSATKLPKNIVKKETQTGNKTSHKIH